MITRIELTNFMSHAHTVIEPAAGLTVLVGANNVGKSAVVAALQILCHNESSTYVMRHGEKQCSVKVETDDGHAIEWRRKNSPSYVIDGQTFDRLGIGGTPGELHHALRLPKVGAVSDADFDVHFGTQKSPIFLLGSTGANAARFFASSSDASRLVRMQKLHRDKLTAAQKEKSRLETESRQLNAELELLEPVVDLDRRLQLIEATHQELVYRETWLEEATVHEQAMQAQSVELTRQTMSAAALAALAAPPPLAPLSPLQTLIAELTTAEAKCQFAHWQSAALASLPAPPTIADEKPLAQMAADIAAIGARVEHGQIETKSLHRLSTPPEIVSEMPLNALITALEASESEVARWQHTQSAATLLPMPPTPADVRPIAELVKQLQTVAAQIATCESELKDTESSLVAAADELRAKATDSSCSVCGSPLDPDRVVARAAAGLGEHDHG